MNHPIILKIEHRMTRLNKFLSMCGIASRRAADKYIIAGRVLVNGEKITTLGSKVDEAVDTVMVDGVLVSPIKQHTHIVLNKPAGYITSLTDPQNRPTVKMLIKELPQRVYPVGRLDSDTEGVLLFTNDGELAFRLTHPQYGIKRLYLAVVEGHVSDANLKLFPKGIKLPDGAVGKARVRKSEFIENKTEIELELTEGRNHEIKHLCRAIGHPVLSLTRIDFAGIKAGNLKKGRWRHLTQAEVDHLKMAVKLTAE